LYNLQTILFLKALKAVKIVLELSFCSPVKTVRFTGAAGELLPKNVNGTL
jgi:hypothetical protein